MGKNEKNNTDIESFLASPVTLLVITFIIFVSIGLFGYFSYNKSHEKKPNDISDSASTDIPSETEPSGILDVPDEKPDATTSPEINIDTNKSDDNIKEMTLEEKMTVKRPEMMLEENKRYHATIDTSHGSIKVSLNSKETPITVNNFVSLANIGFYKDTTFHRIIKGFMIQGGDPKGTGTGGPGYKFDDEKFTGEYTKGTLAMANAGPNTNGSQFFIMHKDYPLPPNYTIFGKVIEGIDVVDEIAEVKTNSGDAPLEPVMINNITVEVLD